MARKFRLFHIRRHSLKTAFGVTGAKRRYNNSLKRLFGLPTRRRSFWARYQTARRTSDREARHQAALARRAARYHLPALPEKIADPLCTLHTERGILTITARDVVLQPYNGLPPMIVVPHRSVVKLNHFIGVPPIFGWHGTMHLVFHTRDGFQLNIRRAPYPEAKYALEVLHALPPPSPRPRKRKASSVAAHEE